MEKLASQPKEATTRFAVDLPSSLHRQLSVLTTQTGRTKADIVRALIVEALDSE